MRKEDKEIFVADMKERLGKAKATFLVDYQGLDVEAMNLIRKELRKIDAEFSVVKNRLLKLASQGTESESISDQFVGPCALAITYEDVVAPAKVLIDQNKQIKNLDIKVGQLAGKAIDFEGIKKLASLPNREVLLSLVLSAMQAVPTSFVRALNGVTLNLVNVVKAIERKKTEEEA